MDINNYLNKKFKKLPLSNQNFTQGPVNKEYKGLKPSGKNIDKKYRMEYLQFVTFYKSISCYLK